MLSTTMALLDSLVADKTSLMSAIPRDIAGLVNAYIENRPTPKDLVLVKTIHDNTSTLVGSGNGWIMLRDGSDSRDKFVGRKIDLKTMQETAFDNFAAVFEDGTVVQLSENVHRINGVVTQIDQTKWSDQSGECVMDVCGGHYYVKKGKDVYMWYRPFGKIPHAGPSMTHSSLKKRSTFTATGAVSWRLLSGDRVVYDVCRMVASGRRFTYDSDESGNSSGYLSLRVNTDVDIRVEIPSKSTKIFIGSVEATCRASADVYAVRWAGLDEIVVQSCEKIEIFKLI